MTLFEKSTSMQIIPFPAHYQLGYHNFDFSSFSRISCRAEVDQMLCDFDLMSDYTWIVDNGIRIFLTHGHVFGESHLPRAHFDILFNGHTHLPHITRLENGSVVVNTGSPTFPKGGNPPTFVIYEDRVVSLYDLEGTLLQSLHL